MFTRQIILFFAFLCATGTANAAFVFVNGKFVNADAVATEPPEVHYGMGMAALEKSDLFEAIHQFSPVVQDFPNEPFYQDACYWLGVAYYHIEEYDFANDAFDKCLQVNGQPKFFEKALFGKFSIAEKFRSGAKRRCYGSKHMPKWARGDVMAIEIYDEIIAALPCHELTAKVLYAKGSFLWEQKDYHGAVAAFEGLIKRFPMHELTPKSYRNITRIYYQQSRYEYQNPDLIALAEINKKKFERDFPGDEKVQESERDLMRLKETYANGLYETGRFYERIGKPEAAAIYYRKTIGQYPETEVAERCHKRLGSLKTS